METVLFHLEEKNMLQLVAQMVEMADVVVASILLWIRMLILCLSLDIRRSLLLKMVKRAMEAIDLVNQVQIYI